MGSVYNNKNYGLLANSQLERGTKFSFSSSLMNLYTGGGYSNDYCLVSSKTAFGSTWNNDQFIEINPHDTYFIGCMAKTLNPNYLGNPGSWYAGFSCFDSNFLSIAPNHLYARGATTLSRNLNQGDSYIYVNDATNFYQNATFNNVLSRIIIFPPDHPVYSKPYEYSRIEFFYDCTDIVLTQEGDYRLTVVNSNNTPVTVSSAVTPWVTESGVPCANSHAGAGHQYNLAGNQTIPYDWQTYFGVIGGFSTNSSAFRWGTKYIKFLQLINYVYRTQQSGDAAEYLVDNIFIGKDSSFRKNIIGPEIFNGDFEEAGSGGAEFANWSVFNNGSSSLNRDTSVFYSGSASCRQDIGSGSSLSQLTSPNIDDIVSGQRYQISWWAKASKFMDSGGTAGGSSVRVQVGDASSVFFRITTEWEQYTTHVVAGNSKNFKFQFYTSSNVGHSVWIDNITVQKVKHSKNIIERS
jgi:hypothetical protein